MGRTIPPRDPDELSKALIEILSDPIDYAEKQEKVKNQFSPSAIAEQYEALFEQLLQN
jgi:glycosyltransferase involved in cell wall biosynthesis